MNIILDRNVLLTPISKLVSITEKRSLMPILSNILIAFDKERTTIYSTDLEISATGYIDYKSEYEKKIVVHGRKFLEILKEMDNEKISLSIKENELTIKQKQTEIVLSLQDPEEFPEVKEIGGQEEFTIEGNILLEMIDKVGFAISIDETRFILTGMHMRGVAGNIKVVGTDGFRMALYQREIEGIKDFKGITIPKRSLTEIERVIEGGEEIKITINDKHVQVSTGKEIVVTRTIEGNFPDFENVIPTKNKNIVIVEKERLLKGLKRVSSIMGRSEPVRITLKDSDMEIDADSDIGHAKEIIDVDYKGENISMNFNVRFILDVVSHTEGTSVVMKAPSEYGAVLFEGKEDERYRNIVMPIRL